MSRPVTDPALCVPELAMALVKLETIMRLVGHPIRIVETVRSRERQAELYEQGRTQPGPIVTNAPPGMSRHTPDVRGLSGAADTAFDGPDPYADNHPWELLGLVGEALGLRWGGRFEDPKDPGHFEVPGRGGV